MKLEIIFRGGAVTTVDVETYTIRHSPTGIHEIRWSDPAGCKRSLRYLYADEVAAVVEVKK